MTIGVDVYREPWTLSQASLTRDWSTYKACRDHFSKRRESAMGKRFLEHYHSKRPAKCNILYHWQDLLSTWWTRTLSIEIITAETWWWQIHLSRECFKMAASSSYTSTARWSPYFPVLKHKKGTQFTCLIYTSASYHQKQSRTCCIFGH